MRAEGHLPDAGRATKGGSLSYNGSNGNVPHVANELLATIHDRMPVIVPLEAYDMWLRGSLDVARDLLTPFPASEMTSHAVSYDVNHPRIDEEYLVQPVEPNRGVTLSLF